MKAFRQDDSAHPRLQIFQNLLGTLLYFFTQWLTTVVVVKVAGYQVTGTYALVVSFCNVFLFLSLFGMRNFHIADVTGRYTTGQYLVARIMAILIAIVACGIGILICNFKGQILATVLVYMGYKILESTTDFLFGLFQKHLGYAAIALSYGLKGILGLGAFTAMLVVRQSLLTANIAMMAVHLAVIIVYDIPWLIHREDFKFLYRGSREILMACFPLMLATLVVPYMLFLTRYCIEKVYGREALGFYSTVSIVIVVVTTLAGAVWAVIVPEIGMAVAKADIFFLRRRIWGVGALLVLTGTLLVFTGSIWGEALFVVVFGQSIRTQLHLLVPVLVASVLLATVAFFSTILIPLGKRTEMLLCNVIGACVTTLTVMPLTRIYGPNGANGSLIIGLLVQLLLLLAMTTRTIRMVGLVSPR